jgi:hypothetical protein
MTNADRAAEHAAKAVELLADSEKINDRNPRSVAQATRATVHASLALYFQRADDR